MNIWLRQIFHKILRGSLCLVLFFIPLTLQSQISEEELINNRPFTLGELSYQPKSLEETLYYVELREFLTQNEEAFILLDAARKGGAYYEAAQSGLTRYLLNPISSIGEGLSFINNNTNLKAKAQLGVKLSNVDVGIEAEINLKQLGSDIIDRFTDEEYNTQVTNTAKYYTREIFACAKDSYRCSLNAQAHQRRAVMDVKWHFHDFPEAVNQEGGLLSFEEKSTHSSQNQLETAQALFKARGFQNISSQLENISAESEQNTEEVIRVINKHVKSFQEEALKDMERKKQTRRNNFKTSDPDYMNEDPVVLLANNSIKKWEAEKKSLSTDLEQGSLSQDQYNQEIESIDQTIEEKKTDIEVYKYTKGLQTGIALMGAVEAGARALGAPEEVIQFSQAFQSGMQAAKSVGAMVIAGAIDPTGVTLAIDSISSVFSILSGTPSADQAIMDGLNQLKKGQAKIFSKLNEIDHKLEGIDAKINSIIEMLNMNHKQIVQKLDHITDELHRVENEIILAIEESKNTTIRESQIIGASFTDDGRVVLNVLDDWKIPHLDKQLLECKQYREQYESTRNLRFYDDYNWCMNRAGDHFSSIQNSLSELYEKSKNRFGTITYVKFENVESLKLREIFLKREDEVENRIGLFHSFVKWINKFYSRNIENINKKITSLWSNREKQWKEYDQFVDRLEDLKVKHPLYLDDAFSVYVPLTEKLPRPEYLSIIVGAEASGYEDEHLAKMCQDLKHIEELSHHNRENLEKAWWVYLYLSNQLKEGLDKFFEGTLEKLLETYKEKNTSQSSRVQQNCNCSNAYAQTEDQLIAAMSMQRQTDIFQYIQDQGYNIYEFLALDPEETARKASERSHITNSYLITEGFYQNTRGDCLKVRKPGEDESSKKVPYNEAEWEIEEQQEHYHETFRRLERENKCLVTDRDGLMRGLTKGSQFQLQQYVSFKNVVGREEKELQNMCITSKRRLDGTGLGSVIGGIAGGIIGVVVDSLTLGLSAGAGTALGSAGGGIIGGIIDGEESAFSICETAELRRIDISNFNEPGLAYLLGQSLLLQNIYYNKRPLTSYLKSETFTYNEGRDQLEVYPYHIECTKKACLKFTTKKTSDKNQWIETAALKIRETQGYLNNRLKPWFKELNVDGSTTDGGAKLYQALPISVLALDSMARAGYGQSLSDQSELSKIINNELNNIHKAFTDPYLTSEQVLTLIKNLRDLPENDETPLPDLPIQPVNKENSLGLGITEKRDEALNIIVNRNYLSPKECRDIRRGRE